VQLLLRLREPTEGRIIVNGVGSREFSFADWARLVAFVPQDAHLFNGTVAENVRFFRDVIDAEVDSAMDQTHLRGEIESWPDGVDTLVGERGRSLSGGQRQRITIARALVSHPDVVVLDEPTSSLDLQSESVIRKTLADLASNATVFIVAHRLSTLDICDRIMVIQGGRLRDFDAPQRLEKTSRFYQEALRLSGLR
jgi:ABC-type multidrug transport system fused ATPase/permease subunit